MNNLSKYTQVAIAVAAFCASSVVMADGGNGNGDHHRGDSVRFSNSTEVDIEKEVDIKREVDIEGDVDVTGLIYVESSSAALVSQAQTNKGNVVTNDIVNNNADASGNVLDGASGNIGLNITAGDNNYQDNSASLSAVDADFVFADAESITYQDSSMNSTTNNAVTNNAGLSGNVLRNSSGNVAANVSAGNSNLQTNSLAASVNTGGTMAEANVSSMQSGSDNSTENLGSNFTIQEQTQVSLTGSLGGGSLSFGGGSYSGTTGGTTAGTSDQIGDVYVDIWSNDPGDNPVHPTNNPGPVAHADYDTATQGGSDLNGDGGALAFTDEGTYEGGESGELSFVEVGTLALGGSFSGVVNNTETVFIPYENNASLTGNALSGASGNIGVNVAAGTNNLQGNHLAIAAATGGSVTIPNPGE